MDRRTPGRRTLRTLALSPQNFKSKFCHRPSATGSSVAAGPLNAHRKLSGNSTRIAPSTRAGLTVDRSDVLAPEAAPLLEQARKDAQIRAVFTSLTTLGCKRLTR